MKAKQKYLRNIIKKTDKKISKTNMKTKIKKTAQYFFFLSL